MCIRIGTYRRNYVCIVRDRYSILLDMNTNYVGNGYYDNSNHLWYDDGMYMIRYTCNETREV